MGWAETVVQTTQLIQQKLNAQVDLIIVMDGSVQNSDNAILDSIRIAIPSVNIIQYQQNKGKGYALRMGVKAVKN